MSGERKGDCQGDRSKCNTAGCPLFGNIVRASRDGLHRVKGCGDPVARGKDNRRKGQRKQAAATRAIGRPRSSMRPGHEETLGGTVRVEVKAGAQVGPIQTRYLAARVQSEASRAFGDHRPFVFLAMPDGSSSGLLVVDLGDLVDVVEALATQLGIVEGYGG